MEGASWLSSHHVNGFRSSGIGLDRNFRLMFFGLGRIRLIVEALDFVFADEFVRNLTPLDLFQANCSQTGNAIDHLPDRDH